MTRCSIDRTMLTQLPVRTGVTQFYVPRLIQHKNHELLRIQHIFYVRKLIESLVRDLIIFWVAFFFITPTDRTNVQKQNRHKKESIMVNQQRSRFIKSRGVCKPTGKKRFFYKDAFQVARDVRRRLDSNHHPYFCKACGDFHVGSSEGAINNMRSPIRRKK